MYRRISTECLGIYLTSSSFRQAVVRDVSLNGFRIEGPSGVPRNTLVMVRLWLPDQEESIDIDQAVVRWVNEREFGVQFVALSNEADLRIATHVEQALRRMTSEAVAC
jgi:hypothetical protein